MKVINVGGAINSGKSTVSEILAGKLKNAVFIEVDDLLSEEEERLFPDFPARIEERLRRLYAELGRHLRERRFDHVIFAYPMTERTYAAIRALLKDKAAFVVVTLNPPLEKCLLNRGTRELTGWETKRIREMYARGFNRFARSDLIIDNDGQTPEQTAETIVSFITAGNVLG